ncbi:MAG: adenine phosphoribosyltransferase [Muricauda sp.]|nr:adenine phosphoribosyltransferase [Allomuricauda sp.]MAU27260.1 adenine phosphoribosyltransferase [Allomuricauda sp.]MBC31165.1 adenine phosphoribosyltransferase [Allomuricauda sp.]|tara:strand:+ start:297 stop:809 length:513 start_codon:yes stop_codon:yes gene_type:complete
MDFEPFIRHISDFPKPGISFKDITPLLNNHKAFSAAAETLFEMVSVGKIDKVVGIDSRGFIFAPILAKKLDAGFVPVRKKGKLPFTTISESFDLEYGVDRLEVRADAIKRGEKVLVHDDVLATGGTAKAVCNLVEKLGGEVVQCNFLIVLEYLNGPQKLNGYPLTSLLTY